MLQLLHRLQRRLRSSLQQGPAASSSPRRLPLSCRSPAATASDPQSRRMLPFAFITRIAFARPARMCPMHPRFGISPLVHL
jgi:hypothetical protein